MKFSSPSLLLVVAQFVLIALMLTPLSNLLSTDSASLIGMLLFVDSLCIFVWAFFSMQRGTFHVVPEPKTTAKLTVSGPYHWVRHPMYSAVLVATLGAAISHATLFHSCVSLALIAVLQLKIAREERFLLATYDDYAEYKSKTKALVPFIY